MTVANIAAGPVAAYGFNESTGTSAADSSGSGNNGTLVNGPTHSSTSKYGLALQFDGVNDMVTVPDANSLDLTTAMSIEAWVRPTALGSWRTVVLKERPGDLVYALYAASRFEDSNTWRPSAWIGAEPVGATAALTLNAWSHLATTYDGASWKFYVNGTLVASRAFTAPIGVSTGALRIGGQQHLARMVQGPDRRGADLQPRAERCGGRARPRHTNRTLIPEPAREGGQPALLRLAGTEKWPSGRRRRPAKALRG